MKTLHPAWGLFAPPFFSYKPLKSPLGCGAGRVCPTDSAQRASESLVAYSKHCSLINFMCQALKNLHLSLRNSCKLLKSLGIFIPPCPAS